MILEVGDTSGAPERTVEVRISARAPGLDLGLAAFWSYRDLLLFLALRDIKVRYSQTLLGAAWAVLQPLAAAAVFALFLRGMGRSGTAEPPYVVFVLAGLVPWVFFANAVLAGANSIIISASIVTKVYFPRVLIPAAAVLAGVVDLAVSGCVLLSFAAWRGADLFLRPTHIIFSIGALIATALGVAFWTAALNVRYRDFRHALPFLVQLGLFTTPVIYPISSLPPAIRSWLPAVNPMAGVIETFRAGLFGVIPPPEVGHSWLAASLLILLTGAAVFRWVERDLADTI
jgi:lipopolysaccharide transport system permease protein